jgi:hypothetical protein
MFLRRHRKHTDGETYQYWSLVKTVRTARGPRHQVVARLGKLDGAEVGGARSWQDVDALLAGRPPATQLELDPGPPPPPVPCWREVDLSGCWRSGCRPRVWATAPANCCWNWTKRIRVSNCI